MPTAEVAVHRQLPFIAAGADTESPIRYDLRQRPAAPLTRLLRLATGSEESVTEPSRAVFLSYASQDAEVARRICEALQAGHIEVWFDQSELRGGDAWDLQIRKQIHDCALFIPIISASSQARSEGYFRLEWKLAVERTHLMSERMAFLVPVVTDDTSDAAADVPPKFREVQWTRLPGGETSPTFVDRVSRLLEPGPAPGNVRGSEPSLSASTQTTPRRTWIRAPLVAIPLAGLVIGFLSLHRVTAPTDATRSGSSAPRAIPEKSVTVLPFVDMSEKHDQEYFSDGLSEELIDRLSKVSELRVPARTSSFFFKGKQTTIADVAKALRVAYVLEGSVRKAGNTLRITAQLIRASDGYHLWSETYDRKADEIFKVQDEVSAAVSQVLQAKLPGAATSASSVPGAEAHNYYLLGLYQYRLDGTRPSTELAIVSFRKAMAIDPGYASAWVALSRALQWSVLNEWIDRDTGPKEARGAAERAIAVDPSSAEAHANLGSQLRMEGDSARANVELAKAVVLDPLNEHVLNGLGDAAAEKGRYAEAIDYYKQALARDPLSTGTIQSLADAYAGAGQLSEAEATYRQALAVDPGPGTRALLSFVLTKQGRATEALAELRAETNPVGRLEGLYRAYHALGRTGDAHATLLEFETRYGPDHPSWVAGLLALTGRSEQSFDWFERAVRQRDPQLLQMVRDPEVAAILRNDPRYQALLRTMNLPE